MYKLNIMKHILISALLLSIASCATQKEVAESVSAEYQDFVDKSESEPISVPSEVTDALLSGDANSSSEQNYVYESEEKRFDVSVQKVPAKTFFVSLVSQAGVNVVAHPEIEGVISLDLRNVTVEEVLSVVRDVHGYEYSYRNGIYTIYPRKLRTQLFHIDYPDFKRVGITDTSVLIGNINSSGGGGGNSRSQNSGGGGQNSDSANLVGQASEGEESSSSSQGFSPGSRVQTLNSTNFWPLLQQSLNSMIGGDLDGRFVMTNPIAGIVVVRALPIEISAVREFLEKSELSVQRQVILETKILEVQLNDQHSTGINWSAVSGALSLQNVISGIGNVNDVLFNSENTSEVVFGSSLQVGDITKLINLLDQQGEVSVLSSPRISTVNNQKAVIRVGSDEFFVTGVSNSTTASASTVTNTPEVELSSFFSGISLDVTPQIADDGDVILHVHPIVSSVQDQLKEFQIGDDNFSLPLALRDIRESDSIVKAASGQVVVLGGLMQESSSGVDTRRSALGDVPVLNIFFKHKEKTLKKTELVILMRPIVVDEDSMRSEVQRGKSRFENFSRN